MVWGRGGTYFQDGERCGTERDFGEMGILLDR